MVKVNTRWDKTDPHLSLVPTDGTFKPVLVSGESAIYTSRPAEVPGHKQRQDWEDHNSVGLCPISVLHSFQWTVSSE